MVPLPLLMWLGLIGEFAVVDCDGLVLHQVVAVGGWAKVEESGVAVFAFNGNGAGVLAGGDALDGYGSTVVAEFRRCAGGRADHECNTGGHDGYLCKLHGVSFSLGRLPLMYP